ncbi:MAG: hypothetical protein ACYTE6_10465 [Planctomycetota bacterium]|jgi:hypothetical protein
MRRRLLIIAIFLLAGAVVNVGVAWCGLLDPFSRWPQISRTRLEPDQAQELHRRLVPRDSPLFGPEVELTGRRTQSVLATKISIRPATTIFRSSDGTIGTYFYQPFRFVDVGLPLRCVRHFRGTYSALWPGFAFNTVFYAAILWLLIPGPFALRRLVRRRRGLCPACGYDLKHAEHESCPECGGGLKKPAAA